MTPDLRRLLNPRSIAVVGGGAWCASIIGAARQIGYQGDIFPVHPKGKEIAGLKALRSLSDWQGPIDAAFIGVNRRATLSVVQELRRLKAGGAICFASGFSEAVAEDAQSASLQSELVNAAGEMPILGPNCYGLVNALDRAAIWPDQHGMTPVDRGVAILTQSSNIAINLTMQRRGLPLAMMITCGNSAQTRQAAIARALLDDPRITVIGVHIEGFGDLSEWEDLAQAAFQKNVPIVALKVGRSDQARHATVSHTASLAGSDAGAQALLDRLGIARLDDLPSFLEALKLLHTKGPMRSRQISAISCSGGEASLIADMAQKHALEFSPLHSDQKNKLRAALGDMVALANPLDYHTYIWRDAEAMGDAWAAMATGEPHTTISIVDYPHTDAHDWICATQAAKFAAKSSDHPFIVAATLPELMPEAVSRQLMAAGVVPMCGLAETLSAIDAAASIGPPHAKPVWAPNRTSGSVILTESDAKRRLAAYGLEIPHGLVHDISAAPLELCDGFKGPLAVKGQGLAHKTEADAVHLGVSPEDVPRIAGEMDVDQVLVEEMVGGALAELLVGVTSDPAHGFVLTLAAGGVMTELMADSTSLLLPVGRQDIEDALQRLRIARVLAGYRGKPTVNMTAVIDAVMAVQEYVSAHRDSVTEVEINPLICTSERAVAADALIRLSESEV